MNRFENRVAKLENHRAMSVEWPPIQYIGWNDGQGPFCAFIPGQTESLVRDVEHGDPNPAETIEDFEARAEARYAEIRALCESKGVALDPKDPFQDLLDKIAREGRTILSEKRTEEQHDE